MKILICGGRDFNKYGVLDDVLFPFLECNELEIISGGAPGADSLAERYAKQTGVSIEVVLANWDRFGKSAGFIRNQEMIDQQPDLVVAFWDGVSKGTADTIRRAKEAKIKTYIVYY